MTPVTVVLAPGADLDGFRAALRRLVAAEVPPEAVLWSGGSAGLFAPEAVAAAPPVPLPGAVAELIRLVVCHRDPERFALLYRLVWRVRHGERALLEVASDPLVHRLGRMAKAVRRDLHKMHAFVRFRRVEDAGGERFVAWFEPEHFILEATAGFFARRFQ
jgi:DNA polymerase